MESLITIIIFRSSSCIVIIITIILNSFIIIIVKFININMLIFVGFRRRSRSICGENVEAINL